MVLEYSYLMKDWFEIFNALVWSSVARLASIVINSDTVIMCIIKPQDVHKWPISQRLESEGRRRLVLKS